MIGAAYDLLNRYPPSFAKSQAARVLHDVDRQSHSSRALRFVVYDIVYAFQQLEARRLGIRADRQPIQHAQFRRDHIAALAMWVPGKDQYIDGLREALVLAARHDDDQLSKILQDLAASEEHRFSMEQRRKASLPRKPKAIDEYIRAILIKNPKITLDGLWDRICMDEFGDVIETIEHDAVYVRGVEGPYSRSSIRNRFYKLRKLL